ncbi:DNA methylase [Catellatospora sp. IY07-71]|uniref:BREX-2 system adenine-specific DNA-methyltransferase PglX n=1 Tax=Catellatospora sp. IY07-71 TaxID=2728827 RepID=UPI001BB371F9|nr:BREX-2 system adenine-specific DNA-methyltransferase PglX [Catellatospora sp. IY07-71]BCJ76183.1 DNA methylase [Catellatospora sp. IY07-71]
MIETRALQRQAGLLVDDLRTQVAADSELSSALRKEHTEAQAAKRVGVTYETWLEGVLDQAAVAWVLACVFVRFCEDNRLIDRQWLGGPEADASVERALQARQAYLITNPAHNDRHWLRDGAFAHLRGLRATAKIFDDHNPVWRFDISADAAEALSDFFRRGDGHRSLRSETLDTRFLGDLYQDLSAHARSTYALLQTPEFVEEFILDRTLEPALKEFGLAETSVIDPTCGSGHFLLGAFHRLLAKWREREPATAVDALVERALEQVTGVDINPFAVAIARFRLLVAALRATGRTNLNNTYLVRVATGDSLLEWGERSGHQGDLVAELEGRPVFAYVTEDADLLADYLRPSRYTVVVGNPPYITVKDKTLNEHYRDMYSACSGKYALSVPFAQRFFELAKRGDKDGDGAGHVGQITANSFMKREFGKTLINEYFAGEVELTEVIDTSGAYIPGHGTPTVILIGTNRYVSQRYSSPIRTVLGVRGEPGQPEKPSEGLVWTAIVTQIDEPGTDTDWISVADSNRDRLAAHPWSLSGGGASEVLNQLNRSTRKLGSEIAGAIGFASFPGQDEAFFAPGEWFKRRYIPDGLHRPLIIGELVRDWHCQTGDHALVPYRESLEPLSFDPTVSWGRHLWTLRRTLGSITGFGGQTRADSDDPWWTWYRWVPERYRTPLSISFAFVATHNHFVLDRGGKVFNRSAPVIKLSEEATKDDHLRLLGLLNSSTACFWLKQVSQGKSGSGIGRGIQPEDWMERYEFTGTKLEEFPLPSAYPLELGRELDGLARRLAEVTPAAVAESRVLTWERLAEARADYASLRARMIALQEDLDWRVYQLYGLLDEDLTAANPPELALGERAFEIVLARKLEAGEAETQWFERHGSTPITELPAHWPADYRALVEKRIAIIESDRNIGLIERPECKRRWNTPAWDDLQKTALEDWLLDRLEASALWGVMPAPLSVAQLADRIRHDADFRSVLDLWVGTDHHDLVKTLGKLVADEHVPLLPTDRYKPSGLRKRAQWERTWSLQRREDAGEKVDIAVPPKYTSADFAKPSYWRNRGKLDVPKERFISYPRMGRDEDGTELLGWAGWDHLQQAQALATVYLDRKQQAGWPVDRLLPLLAGLAELEPWLKQWHDDPKPGYLGTPAKFFSGLIDTELGSLGSDRSTLIKLRGVEELA